MLNCIGGGDSVFFMKARPVWLSIIFTAGVAETVCIAAWNTERLLSCMAGSSSSGNIFIPLIGEHVSW